MKSEASLYMQKMSTSKVKRMDSEVEKAFNVFDKDQDGKITRTEIEELVANLGGDIKNPNFQVLFIRFHLLNVKISCSF